MAAPFRLGGFTNRLSTPIRNQQERGAALWLLAAPTTFRLAILHAFPYPSMMFLAAEFQGAQTFPAPASELLDSFKGLEGYVFISLILFLAAIVLGFLILIRGWGIAYRLALIPLALLPFLFCLFGSIWEIATSPYSRHLSAETYDMAMRHEIANDLILLPFGALQSLLLLMLSFLTFIQAGNGQLAYVLPGRSIHPA